MNETAPLKYGGLCLVKGRTMKLTMEILEKNIDGTYEIDSSGFVNVEGDVYLDHRNLDSFGNIKFGKVTGYFWCFDNNLTSLEGSPKEVSGNFYCYSNNLTSLEGSPKYVGGNFVCSHNKLTSLEGSPKEVGGDFYCYNNPLTNFDLHCKVKGEIYSGQELNVKHPYSKEILRELINDIPT